MRNFNTALGRPRAVLRISGSVSERVNPHNSWAMSVLTSLFFKLNTLQTKIVKLWVSRSHGVMTVVYWIYTGYYTTIMTSRWLFRHNPVSRVQINQSENSNSPCACYFSLSSLFLTLWKKCGAFRIRRCLQSARGRQLLLCLGGRQRLWELKPRA